ncbi:cytochrome b N-terminal domain-containing protein [Sorangium sp. So ce233]|uniref:cytochrome b N-terminal domain-containing protein n=1 Tax=Sorangium sp. So ce233 TaxID=3133290 RepID=UPI003F5EF747
MRILRSLGRWFYDRLALSTLEHILKHKVPPELASRKGWMYVFGFATLTAFIVQLVTGSALVTKYIPSPAHAHASLQHLTNEVPLGWLARAMHYYGASAMVLFVFLHMARVYLTGSYKFPREMNWISGVMLMFLVMSMALTGQLLRWDENGVWTVVVAAKFAGRVPLIGEQLSELVLAGETVGGTTLSRFFAFHVFILPALIIGLVTLHIYLLYQHGISEPPKAGSPVDPKTYRAWYRERVEKLGVPYFPDGLWREVVVAAALVFGVVTLALLFGPKGPGAAPDPTQLATNPRPDWFVRWYYALLWVKPRGYEDLVMVYAPLGVLFLLILLPLVARRGERSPARRVWAILLVGLVALGLGSLIVLGTQAPWTPAVGTRPLTAEALGAAPGPVREGAQLFYERGCQYCHAVLGEGGQYGPELTGVAKRLSSEEITVRIVNGIRDMPAYRDLLPPGELEAIVLFLRWVPERAARAAEASR